MWMGEEGEGNIVVTKTKLNNREEGDSKMEKSVILILQIDITKTGKRDSRR